MRELKTELVKLSKLKPDTRNARLHDERNIEEIKRSLVDNEQYAPLIVQRSTGKILAGNGRYTAMKELDWQECYVTYIDCTDEEATKIALTDNRTSELAEWDFATLKDLMQELGPEPDVAGWSNDEIEDMFQMFSDGDTEVVQDEIPEVQKETVSQRGYVWICGNHRVMCGDSTLEADTDKLANGERADMVFTDPPYNVAIGSKNAFLNSVQKAGRCCEDIEADKGMTDEEIGQTLWKPAFEQLYRLAKDDCSIYVTMPQGGAHMMMMLMCGAFWQVKHELIWVKNAATFSMGRLDYDYQHEPILYGWKKSHNFYGRHQYHTSVIEDENRNFAKMKKEELVKLCEDIFSEKRPTSILRENKPQKCDLHPTMKPIKLIARVLENSSIKGNTVFDFFGGSGSTLIACEQLNRKCYTMEIDPQYVDVIVRRWQKLTGEEAILEGTGETFNELAGVA